jgi:hypothetical protein
MTFSATPPNTSAIRNLDLSLSLVVKLKFRARSRVKSRWLVPQYWHSFVLQRSRRIIPLLASHQPVSHTLTCRFEQAWPPMAPTSGLPPAFRMGVSFVAGDGIYGCSILRLQSRSRKTEAAAGIRLRSLLDDKVLLRSPHVCFLA